MMDRDEALDYLLWAVNNFVENGGDITEMVEVGEKAGLHLAYVLESLGHKATATLVRDQVKFTLERRPYE